MPTRGHRGQRSRDDDDVEELHRDGVGRDRERTVRHHLHQAMSGPRLGTRALGLNLHARCAEREARLVEHLHAAREELGKLRRDMGMTRRCARCEQSKGGITIAHGADYGYWAGKPLCVDCHWDRLWMARHNHQTAVELTQPTVPETPSRRRPATVVSLPIRRQLSPEDPRMEPLTLPTAGSHRSRSLV
jgi:hypothetical protein